MLRDLTWEIQQALHQLTSSHNRALLCKLAESFKEEVGEDLPGAESTEVELFDFIVDFLRSPQVKDLEDQGMSRLPSVVADPVTGLFKLSELKSLLPHREYKIHGGQISDFDSDLSYNTLCKQIDEGLTEGFTEAEIIRTVLKIIKPGTFKNMLVTKHTLTVAESTPT